MYIDRGKLKEAAKAQISGNILTYFGLTVVIAIITGLSSVSAVGPIVLAGPLSLGLSMFMMQVVRTGKGDFSTGFKGFNFFGSAFIATLLMSIFTFLWTLLFWFPGIIALYRYSMTFYIIADNPGISGSEAINRSKIMMQGHKWELFVLHFSFFWWYILCMITGGLASIYVCPYVHAADVNFYEALKAEYSQKIEQ